MKKSKRRQAEARTAVAVEAAPGKFVWWPWAAALAALFLAFEAYSPALNGPFVFDDAYLPFQTPGLQHLPVWSWISGLRPLLMLSFWLNYAASGEQTFFYHATNVLLHLFNSVLVALIAIRLLELASLKDGPAKPTLGIFAGALFLLHPMQTESVAYVASRSEVLSVLFYYGAYCVFLYRRTERITLWRALAVLALFGAAASTKEHALTLPILLLLTDLYWIKGGIRANALLYGQLAAGGVVAGATVWRVLRAADTAGFHVPGLTPLSYLYTQGRVFWAYLRLLALPFGLNVDPDVAISQTPLDHGAIFGLLAIAALLAAAWIFRKRCPLAAFGVLVFVLLLLPTSSIVPIKDPMAEHRVYLPFLGFALVPLEFLRRMKLRQRLMIEVPALLVLLLLTYQRSALWGDPLALWRDSAAKSPRKVRPRFQLAYAYWQQQNCPKAVENFEIASRLAPPDYPMLVDWAYALNCVGQPGGAIEKLREATKKERDAQAWASLGQIYAQQHQITEALDSLQQAQNVNPSFVMIYSVRGNVYESMGDLAQAKEQYQRALDLDPYNQTFRDALTRVLRRR
ncbi:MAG TPA: tetratricopeptide repeat protein [Bryobacteraceae bacterium]|nr:tetratricopeptide repeat protein [Bryobacteraceae bacterium]